MKFSNQKNFLAVILMMAAVVVTSCKNDDPSALEVNTSLLTAHAWALQSVEVDGEDKTSIYEGLALQWKKDNTFTSTDGQAMWPASGTWSFSDNEGKAMSVLLGNNEDADVEIVTLNKTTLVISLHWDESTLGNGRNRSIAGDHVFEFAAQ